MSDFIIVETYDLDCIADGRTFVIRDDVRLSQPDSFPADADGIRAGVRPVTLTEPLECDLCNRDLACTVFAQTLQWIYLGFYCVDHPDEIPFIDVYPKLDPGSEMEWYNSLVGFPVEDLGRVMIKRGPEWPDHGGYRRLARGRKLLTPDGLISASPLARTWRHFFTTAAH